MSRPLRRASAANPIDTSFDSGIPLVTVRSKAEVDYDCIFVKDMKAASVKVMHLFRTCLTLLSFQVEDMVENKGNYR